MSFAEASGQFALYECIREVEARYARARPTFIAPESGSFAELLTAAKGGGLVLPSRRLVVDVSSSVNQKKPTGVGRVELELARQFAAMAGQNNQEIVFTAFDGRVFQIHELAGENRSSLTPTGTAMRFRPGDHFLLVVMRLDVLDEYFTAIYHQAKRNGAIIDFMIHDLIPLTNLEAMGGEAVTVNYLIGFSQVLRFADRIITVSRKVARDIACYIGQTSVKGIGPTRPLDVAYIALGSDALLPHERSDQVLSFPVDGNTFVAVGTLIKHKGLLDLVAAMEILWAEGCTAKLVLLGMDYGKANMRARFSDLPVFGKQLFLPGYVTDAEMAATLRRCNALVCASGDEGFGLPLVEAAALGCPVIARDIEIFRETSGGDAFFFENGDTGKIASGLRQWFALSRPQQMKHVPRKSLVTWKQSAAMLNAIMFQRASCFSLEVGVKSTLNLAVPTGAAKQS